MIPNEGEFHLFTTHVTAGGRGRRGSLARKSADR
jgi:hypothetical protein